MIQRLRDGLASDLYYHNPDHTLMVYEIAREIALRHEIPEQDIKLIQVAALYHDSGFLYGPQAHENASCDIVRKELPLEGFSEEEVSKICGMIQSTQIPQCPCNKLEEVICDADLFYLGTHDYDQIANLLFLEFQAYDILQEKTAWINLQIKFLEGHSYFSNFLTGEHTNIKLGHLKRLKESREKMA